MFNERSDKLELLRIADAVASEKSIDKELILNSMETAIQKAAKTRYGQETQISAKINRESGNITLHRVLIVSEKPENTNVEISLEEARKREKNPELKVGDEVTELLPNVDLGRIAAQTAKQVISQRVRDAEREKQYNDFKDKKGEILSGIVKRLEFGNVIVDLGRTESVIRKEELIPREIIKPGDRIKAYCYDVRREIKGPQIFLSRSHPDFMSKLFSVEVPEIYDGIIEIKSAARDPGSRAKICVHSTDSSLDPVGACVGMRGSRVQAVVNELQGEKIDIVLWSEDPATLAINALAPAEIQKVVIDKENRKLEVVLSEANLSKAIGRRGQNVRLASKLMDYEIEILTDSEESERRQADFKEKSETLINNLELDETLGQLLVAEGISSIEEISQLGKDELSSINGIDENTADELKKRSEEFLKKEKAEIEERLKKLGMDENLLNLKGLTPGMLLTLGEKKIKTIKDFAELSSDELTGAYDEIKGEKIKLDGYLEDFALSKKEADDLIMAARAIVFD